jgi:hypothetical protein
LAYLFVPLHPATNKGRERKEINAKQKEGRLAYYSCLSIVRFHHATNKGRETPRAVTPAAIRDSLRPAATADAGSTGRETLRTERPRRHPWPAPRRLH